MSRFLGSTRHLEAKAGIHLEDRRERVAQDFCNHVEPRVLVAWPRDQLLILDKERSRLVTRVGHGTAATTY